MAECLLRLEVCQQQGEQQDYAFNWTAEFIRQWETNHPFNLGTRIRPSSDSVPCGFELVSGGGQSGGSEPSWRSKIKALDDTVTDGSITWTGAALSYAGLRHRLVLAEWTAAEGQELYDQEEQDSPGLQETRIWVRGGEPGKTYEHKVGVTTDQGAKYEAILSVTVDA